MGKPDVVAPFPWFGGKRTVASEVWQRFGDVRNYVEPFFGSGAVLLSREYSRQRTETVNDADGMISNFWRAVQAAPDDVAKHADWPVNECDLHARHCWLVRQKESLADRLMGDPDYFDAKIAGWWVWGICAWIGRGWCSGKGPWQSVDGVLVKGGAGAGINKQLPHLFGAGMGINKQLPHLGDAGMGINKQLPHLGDAGRGINKQMPHLGDAGRGEFIREWMQELSARLRGVRVACGDWSRVCGPSVTTKNGVTAVFLDPPYSHDVRDDSLYSVETDCSEKVRQWAIENGNDKKMRIALCGYDNEHGGKMPDDWVAMAWKSQGGYGSQGNVEGRENSAREVIWFSPHCIGKARQGSLFDMCA